MTNRLEQLRLFFPAEVTGGYLAIQNLLAANGVGASEYMWFMAFLATVLAAINSLIYWKIYQLESMIWQVVLILGFAIWVLNMDNARYEDMYLIGAHIEIVAPVLLVLYTLLTTFFKLPRKRADEQAA
jgi:hypothetical protein